MAVRPSWRCALVTVYIEGENLRIAFSKLFREVLLNQNPRFKDGRGTHMAVEEFKKDTSSIKKFLIIDSDTPVEDVNKRQELLHKFRLEDDANHVFFMIQEMEAWFISQPEILDIKFKVKISSKYRSKFPQAITSPSDDLQRELNNLHCKFRYSKGEHGPYFIQQLDIHKLRNDFPDVDNFIKAVLNVSP